MIRINLLPVRAARKKETARQQATIALVSIAGVILIFFALYSVTLGKISSTRNEISNTENEIQQLTKKIGEIDNIKKLQAEVKKKLDVLAQLRKEKTGPAIRLATLSDAVPEKLWLTKYAEGAGGTVSISGIAFSEDLIADFMRRLQASADFSNVELQVSEQSEVSGVKLKRFDIACMLKGQKKEEAPKK